VILESVRPASVGRVFSCMAAILGVPTGIFFALAILADHSAQGQSLSSVPVMAVSMLFVVPIAMAMFGMIKGVIAALLYNFVAARIGGIEIAVVERGAAAETSLSPL
jgi:hypothetical protein